MPYRSGQKPGRGTYVCTGCGECRDLNYDTDPLPSCDRCNNNLFTRY
ncbi:zinc ribbon-containing protein [Methanobacterium paludis]|uniref:Uncharacterized protein n=1 Tax=Methanobacterium paludis (strain DSM 25820 / JCM 18151 / SWAN1) TaxID=868131 RepID=F6D6Q8_METPW|nr:hypothetical protein [Methanobacterium paludis]AEG18341.1 hypothetical protein MSWAN_1325 [Methanobacterium paludis]